ncbi:MAG: AraC family transcriptional regulator [Verrucomicrobiaceae bacterium]|nr:AraC family transcriptional regulator [Verrucomicrobiaceae bacterium]
MDLLSDILSAIQIESTFFGRQTLTAPWGYEIPHTRTVHFLSVTSGNCWLLRPAQTPQLLENGDFVMFTRPTTSVFASAPDVSIEPLVDLIRAHYSPDYSIDWRNVPPFDLHHGGGGRITELVGGAIDLPADTGAMLINSLPEFIYLNNADAQTRRWLQPLMNLIAEEIQMAAANAPGYAAISKRLAELLFLRIIQVHWVQNPTETSGWLRGLSDARIAKVLQAMHSTPQHSWTLAILAEVAGMSRSALAERFAHLIGEPPIQYLTRWRMHLAALQFTNGEKRTAIVAESVGYQSEIAFAKTFKRFLGVSPAAYRRAALRH